MAFCSVYGEFHAIDKEDESMWITAFSRAPEGEENDVYIAQGLSETMPKGEWLLTVKPLKSGVFDMVSNYQSSHSSILAIKEKVFAATFTTKSVVVIHMNTMESVPNPELVDFFDAVDDYVEDSKQHTLRVGLDNMNEEGTVVFGWHSNLDEQTNVWSAPVRVCGPMTRWTSRPTGGSSSGHVRSCD